MGTTMVAPVMAKRVVGGAFLIEDLGPNDIFTPEDFSPEQKQIADVAVAFSENEVLANAAAIEGKDWSMNRKLMKKAGELGLLGIDVPEEYGGLEMDKITSTLVADYISTLGSFSVTFGAHSGGGVRSERGFGGLRRDEHSHAGGVERGRQHVHAERREDVDLECGLCGHLHRLRQDGREDFGVSGGARDAWIYRGS
jgi:hypothetical protein